VDEGVDGQGANEVAGHPTHRREVERSFWHEIAKGLSSEDAALGSLPDALSSCCCWLVVKGSVSEYGVEDVDAGAWRAQQAVRVSSTPRSRAHGPVLAARLVRRDEDPLGLRGRQSGIGETLDMSTGHASSLSDVIHDAARAYLAPG
jgi:hypothetical protein